MRVLMAHKFFRLTGGTETYFRELAAILEANGHQTIPFAVKHPDNPPTPYKQYFLEELDYRSMSLMYKVRNGMRILSRTLYSWEARRKIDALIRDTRPDLAHLQAIDHHISPSILHSLKKHKIPVVQSANTYKLVCASYRLYDMNRGEICERCLYRKHYRAVRTRCLKGSFTASLLVALEMYLHQLIKIYDLVDRFIVPNSFLADKFICSGIDPARVVILRNPFKLDAHQPHYDFDDYMLYFGRLDPEKGVMTLVKAMRRLPGLRLVVVGDGVQFAELVAWVEEHDVKNVEFVGPKWGAELEPILARARCVVVPSEWYEPSPMVIYQALATGKPVVGARIGGIPDLLTPKTGVLFTPGDVDDLATKLDTINSYEDTLRSMGRQARRWAEENLNPEKFYQRLMSIYNSVGDGSS